MTTSHLDSEMRIESDGAYSDLDLETNGSDTDYKPLPSEEMHIFGQDIDMSDIIWLSSPELHVPFYRWRIVVRVTYLRVQVCHCHICSVSLWRLSGPIPKTYKRANGALGTHSWAKMDWYLSQKQHIYTWSARLGLWEPRMLIRVGFFKINITIDALTSDLL